MRDLIDRNDAIEAISKLPVKVDNLGYTWMIAGDVLKQIDDIPPAEPERKKGNWIPVTNGRCGFECNQCHCYAPSYRDGTEWLSHFCPNCGAKLDWGE